MDDTDLKELSYAVRGAAMEVYNYLGPGLLESLYEKAMIYELRIRGVHVESQVPIQVLYKGITLSEDYKMDLLLDNAMIIELKSVEKLLPIHYKQLRSYLKLSNKQMGWLINFNESDFSHGMVKVINRYYIPWK